MFYVSTINNQIIGFIGFIYLFKNSIKFGEIINFCVDSNYRKYGIGTKLLNEIYIHTNNLEIKKLELSVISDFISAKSLYLKHEFCFIDSQILNDGCQIEHMIKEF